MSKSTAFPSHVVRIARDRLLCMAVAFTLLRCLLLPPVWTERHLDLPRIEQCAFFAGGTAVTDADTQALFYLLAQRATAFWIPKPGSLLLADRPWSFTIQADEYIYLLVLAGDSYSTPSAIHIYKYSNGEIIWSNRVYRVPPELLARAIEAFHRLVPDAPKELL